MRKINLKTEVSVTNPRIEIGLENPKTPEATRLGRDAVARVKILRIPDLAPRLTHVEG